jgi:hypothetical protein
MLNFPPRRYESAEELGALDVRPRVAVLSSKAGAHRL